MNNRGNKNRSKKFGSYSVLLFILVLILTSISCKYSTAKTLSDVYDRLIDPDEVDPANPFLGQESPDEPAAGADSSQDAGSSAGSGELKPVGFVNYGEFNAAVRAWTYVPLGATEPQTPSAASTVSFANTGSGTWPNTSRFLSVPVGTYSWCIDWEEGDLDEDGDIDYFHYIEGGPTILDENDSDDLDFAEEVAISAPPATAMVYSGKCKPQQVETSCDGKDTEVNVYSYYALEQDNPPEIFTFPISWR